MKKVLAISSVLLGVVFLAGCGQQPVSQTQPTTSVPVTQQPTQSNTSTTIPIDWQTYTSMKYGFEFMHPSDVGYLSPEGGAFLGFLSDQTAKETNILILGKKLSSSSIESEQILSINSGLENKNVMMQEFIENKDLFDISDIDINGIKFKMYALKNGIYNGYNKAYLFENSKQFIVIRFVDASLANQIISTFKFTK
jgi:hypothetical protein